MCFADALKLMQERGVRRLPVVDGEGALVGILTLDDVMQFFAEEMTSIVNVMASERRLEERYRV